MNKLAKVAMYSVLITAFSNAAAEQDGATTYKLICSSCHESAAAGAPKLEDKTQWKSRLAQGMDSLYASTIDGKCDYVKDIRLDLTDEAIRAAVDYMVSEVQ